MGKVKTLNYFAAIPGRASSDDRLTALHFRVLMVIAGYDRMGRNGQCCWAGAKKLAARAGCHPKRLSTAISDLTSFGYLTVLQGETDKRKRGYRVVYTAKVDAAGIGIQLQDNGLQDGNLKSRKGTQYDESRLRDSNLSTSEELENTQAYQQVSDGPIETQYIPLKQNNNRRYGGEALLGNGSGRQRYGADTHPELVDRLGDGNAQKGWDILIELNDDTREWLEQRCSDGTLDVADVLAAQSEFRQKAIA